MRTRLLAAVALAAAAAMPTAPASAAAAPYAVCTSLTPCAISCASNSIVTVYLVGWGYGSGSCGGTTAWCQTESATETCSRTAVVTGGAGSMWCNADSAGPVPAVAICVASPFIN